MSSLDREHVFLILQFLGEKGFKETAHKLEQESAVFFNLRSFEDLITAGEWEEAERYLLCFTKLEDNSDTFFEIRKHKYFEALARQDRVKAFEILNKDLFQAIHEDNFKEIEPLLFSNNSRDKEELSKYVDTMTSRGILLSKLKKFIEANLLLRDKLQFPTLGNSRLSTLINNAAMDNNPTVDSEHVLKRARPSGLSGENTDSRLVHEGTTQCRSLRLPDNPTAVSRLTYTKAGSEILALTSNAVHKLWEWPEKRTASVSIVPQLRRPSSGILMANDISSTNLEYAVPCFVLTNNTCVVSAWGRKIFVFKLTTFETLKAFLPSRSAATCLALHPTHGFLLAIGMEDSSIQIVSFKDSKVKADFKGHEKRITGLAFSNNQNVLVSTGADSQLRAALPG